MAGAKKGARILVKLLSSAGTGTFYVASRNPRKTPKKMAFVKYDKKVDQRVLFEETKLK
jgi:large subunit ribosomal protein L33